MSSENSQNSLSSILKNKPLDILADTESIYSKQINSVIDSVECIDKLKNVNLDQVLGLIVELGSNDQASKNLKLTRKLITSIFTNVSWSSELVNPDYTATPEKPKPDYTNQCGFISFGSCKTSHNEESHSICNEVFQHSDTTEMGLSSNDTTSLNQESNAIKAISQLDDLEELELKNIDLKSIDSVQKVVLLTKQIEQKVKRSNRIESLYHHLKSRESNANSVTIDIDILALKTQQGMVAIKERYPFKQHEWIGIFELYEKGYLG